ncbi:MAG: carboxypeptidase-like regulatory domain-containing protein [Gemmatimonadota bacterium]|nr:carboxypeptidase-like regulatory domain-containing protein [Gemmatimonadota bacterium]MDQ8147957.1 carboxypeptidase-like regulatory domain-containing protein [Gemmatimonadota bacterium]MDQ8149638.1 carboxypeptidase-like regulatory domain-containing protein [Gemmatimonadota bacterium]MDQ8177302.1 carboxypeptidase-like regulatory domain-containing protein [Gemmatimonadota bacterium]
MTRRRTPTLAAALLAVAALVGACDSALTDPAPYGTIRAVARTRAGEPLRGVAAELYTGQRPMGYGTTDSAGTIHFTRVPEGLYGVLLTLPDSYTTIGALTGARGGDVIDGLRLAPKADTTLTFTLLAKGNGRVEARVLDESDRPVADIPVGLYAPQQIVAETLTDATGIARFETVPYGNYGVFAIQPDSFGVPSAPWVVRDGLIIDRGFVATPTLRLRRCQGRIAVTVRDEAGAPLAGFTVRRFTATRIWPGALSGPDGSALLEGVICGEYGVYLESRPGYSVPWVRDTAYVDGLRVTDGATRAATLRAIRLP